MSAGSGAARVAFTVFAAQLRDRPARLLVALFAIALGIALSAAVYLVNESALEEFGRATRALVGTADLVLRGERSGFAEALYARVAADPAVAIASPVVEVETALAGGGVLTVLGVDPFLAGRLAPALYGELAGHFFELLEPDALALSARAAAELGLARGGTLEVRVGSGIRRLRVVAVMPESAYATRLAVMDIGSAQWTLGRLGVLSRIELRLAPGVEVGRWRGSLQLPPGVIAATPALEEARAENLTRAYRVNLNMLALVALLTGAFLVYSTQALAVMRRRAQLALLRALGVTRGELAAAILVESALVGALGGAIGVLMGAAIARLVLATLGGDLGAGLLGSGTVALHASPLVLASFVLLGALVAVAGAAAPARAAARTAPARALKGDHDPRVSGATHTRGLPLLLIASGILLAFAPPVAGLPLCGYAAIALLLLAAVLLVPVYAQSVLAICPVPHSPVARLALAHLRGTVAAVTVSLGAIVVSFSLMVAMAIMVHSFRDSFERWLGAVLPADLYCRVAGGADSAFLGADDERRLMAVAGVARVELRRAVPLSLAADRPPVIVIARPLEGRAAGLPLLSHAARPSPGLPEAYVSEAVRDLYGLGVGDTLKLPIGGVLRPFYIAGVWRDYARTAGAVVVERASFEAYAGERRYTEGSFWLAPGARAEGVRSRLEQALGGDAFQVIDASALKTRSLAAFDKAFALTYALEAVAVGIGLLGVGFSFAMQAMTRRGEFGMLRHLGLGRRQVLAMLTGEGALLGALGALYGLMVGVGLSLVLIYVVNRQSFHWSVDYVLPLGQILAVAAVLVAAAALTARVSAGVVLAGSAVRAVREDA